MATNKNAQLRYQVLDRCFGDFKHKYTIDELIDKVNDKLHDLYGTEVGVRQIREDIKYMRDRVTYNAPIVAYRLEGKKCYYRYSDSDFSIFKNELSVEDVNNLRSTIDMLSRYRGLPTNAWLEEIISNLEYRFGIKPNSENLISFEQNDQLKGLENLSGLIDAVMNHTTLSVHYKTYKGVEFIHTIYPYYIKEYNNRWFLFGMGEEVGDIENLALDRIVEYSISNKSFKPNVTTDFSTYFDDVIGVSKPKSDVKVENIKLRFTDNRFPYVLSKPLHHTQTIVEGESNTIQIEVRPTRELDQIIFSFIPDIEVLSPDWYRASITEKIKENLEKYSSMKV
jgi:predicted DNA-binding transcriptional regulator YafY